ncbi:hypothetical protein [Sphingomonas sp. ERG5]|uniref:hypothetical protein n=1 Tax=Sphingomonas sp. ERG5 TaxID=1381597 RepID=UPI0006908431|nr:hypothetical protein [Sphingomonas sp. ERG5]
MTLKVNDWKQVGHVYLWRYSARRSKHAGWHMTADGDGCASIADLLDRMSAEAVGHHRTIALNAPSPEIFSVPNFGEPIREKPGTLRIAYEPGYPDFEPSIADGRMILRVGEEELPDLRSAFVEVSTGGGDFALWPKDKKAATPIWFWWMPRQGKTRF